jgi:hypothetical protein
VSTTEKKLTMRIRPKAVIAREMERLNFMFGAFEDVAEHTSRTGRRFGRYDYPRSALRRGEIGYRNPATGSAPCFYGMAQEAAFKVLWRKGESGLSSQARLDTPIRDPAHSASPTGD